MIVYSLSRATPLKDGGVGSAIVVTKDRKLGRRFIYGEHYGNQPARVLHRADYSHVEAMYLMDWLNDRASGYEHTTDAIKAADRERRLYGR